MATRNRGTADARRRRARTTAALMVPMAAAILAGCSSSTSSGKSTPVSSAGSTSPSAAVETGPMGPEGIVLEQGTPLASLATAATGKTVDGIQCNSQEQPAYHIHTHLAVYVNGTLRPVPAGIGIVQPVAQQSANGPFYGASTCYYWLHVHAQDGVIHVESPTTRTYTLGQFFAIWGQPLTKTRVGPATGAVTAYVNGHRYPGDPASISLGSREDIQLDVGTPVPFKTIDWSQSQL